MLGYTEEELLAITPAEKIFSSIPNRAEIAELLRRDHRLRAEETFLCGKSGDTVRVRVTAYAMPNERGELDEVQAYVEDLTEQSALEQQIRAVQKLEAVGRLAGGIAHDFNNVLVVIKLSTEMMLSQITPDSPLTRSLLQVSTAADRAASLTRQMLAFSRRQVMQSRVVNINSVVDDTLHMLRRLIGEDIELVTRLSEHLANTNLDPDQLTQIILNLAVNSRDAMPKGGTLRIETCNVELDETYGQSHPPVLPGSYVMLSVSDTGSGISKEDLTRIFDPFFTTKEAGKGTGLGLAIVYGIVKQSGGYIWVYSEPGLGTTFKLYFPVTQSSQVRTPATSGFANQPHNETILVVEDDADIRTNVCNCLRHLGYHALEASSGEKALALCEQIDGKVDLIMTDLVMPGISGYDMAELLTHRFPEVQLLYTSGYTEDSATRRALLREGTAFLEKPYTVADLAKAVQHALIGKRISSAVS
jgi:signal transduction histidine kinase/CheY-like chemotaxis protein